MLGAGRKPEDCDYDNFKVSEPISDRYTISDMAKVLKEVRRCAWAEGGALMREYHDKEWSVPQHDSRMLWEMLMLEGFQAGLAWIIVLRKREAFRKAFAGFDQRKLRYSRKKTSNA